MTVCGADGQVVGAVYRPYATDLGLRGLMLATG